MNTRNQCVHRAKKSQSMLLRKMKTCPWSPSSKTTLSIRRAGQTARACQNCCVGCHSKTFTKPAWNHSCPLKLNVCGCLLFVDFHNSQLRTVLMDLASKTDEIPWNHWVVHVFRAKTWRTSLRRLPMWLVKSLSWVRSFSCTSSWQNCAKTCSGKIFTDFHDFPIWDIVMTDHGISIHIM